MTSPYHIQPDDDLATRLRKLNGATPAGKFSVTSYQSGTTYLNMGDPWVGHYIGPDYPTGQGYAQASIHTFNIPDAWIKDGIDHKSATAGFIAELVNAYRAGNLVVAEDKI